STTDSGLSQSPRSTVVQTPVTTIYSEQAGRDFSETESVGFRLNWPFVQRTFRTGLSVGLELRHFETAGFQTNIFTTVSVIPPANPNDPPEEVSSQTVSGRVRKTNLTYLPLTLRADTTVPDRVGQTVFSLGATYDLPLTGLSDGKEFEAASGSA